uniref:Rad4 beta-hairpin domain-containing protein n=1 Tax=Anopheles farauti TaxID=69004 RepID=A0A182Q725_9DIPT
MYVVKPLPKGRLKQLLLRGKAAVATNQPDGPINDERQEANTSRQCINQFVPSTTSTSQPDQEAESDSETSSVDDHLVDPEKLNLDESFFHPTFRSQSPCDKDDLRDNASDSDCLVSDVDAIGEDDRMHEIFSQVSDYQRMVKEATNICYETVERRKNELNVTQGTQNDVSDVSLLLTQTEGFGYPGVTNDGEPDWHHVADGNNPPKEMSNIEIVVSNSSNKSVRVLDIAESLKRLERERIRKLYLATHKVHLLLLLECGNGINDILNLSLVQFPFQLYDLIANSDLSMSSNEISFDFIQSVMMYYKNVMQLTTSKSRAPTFKPFKAIPSELTSREASCRKMLNLMLLLLLRFLGVRTRLVFNLNVVPKYPPAVKAAPKVKLKQQATFTHDGVCRYSNVPLTTAEILKRKPEIQKLFHLSQLDGADDTDVVEITYKKRRIEPLCSKPRLWKLKLSDSNIISNSTAKPKQPENTSEEAKPLSTHIRSKYFRKKPVSKQSSKPKKTNTGVSKFAKLLMGRSIPASISGLNKKDLKNRPRELDIWMECYLEKERRWIVVEAGLGELDCLEAIIDRILDPPVYVFAWEADGTIVDVSQRYRWRNVQLALKHQVDAKWLKKALTRYRPRALDEAHLREQLEFRQLKLRAPMPNTIQQFKNHPSYCLCRHLQKFQAIYPPDAPPLGFIDGEPIYARECVQTLHSREVWLRHAKIIRQYEQPYKIVRSKLRRQQSDLELFGYWQTEEYIPPEPIDGIVPRNAFGNIEIFKECMLPKGTVHLKQYGLSAICRKLHIDYAVAVVGFGVHAGGNHPIFDGIVICEEHRDRLLEAWERHQDEAARKKQEKKQMVVLNNWAKLVKGLLVRTRLKNKYNFDGM